MSSCTAPGADLVVPGRRPGMCAFVALIVITSEVLLYATEPQLLLPSVFPYLPVIHL